MNRNKLKPIRIKKLKPMRTKKLSLDLQKEQMQRIDIQPNKDYPKATPIKYSSYCPPLSKTENKKL